MFYWKKIEDEIDLKMYEKAMKAYEKDKRTYSQEEIEMELDL